MTIIFDLEKHFLGKLCKRNHDWENSGYSLRYIAIPSKPCVICVKERSQNYQKGNADKIRKQHRNYNQKNADRIRERMQNYHKENIDTIRERQRNYYQENADRLCEYQQNYYQENVERIHEQRQNYRQTSKGKNSYMRCEQKRRAIENKCHSLPYKQEDILNLFNGECAYCGNKVKLSLDHFIPLTKGGSDVKGNLLPACLSCNSSKGNKDAIDWYKKQPFFNQKRLKQILKILGKTESNYDQIPLF